MSSRRRIVSARFQGEEPLALQDVMHVGLGDSREAGQTTLGGIAATHAMAEIVDQSSPQIVEGHRQAISPRNRVVPESLAPNVRID